MNIVVDGREIAFGQDDVGVENEDIVALGTLDTIVTTLARATVFLQVIMQIKDVCVLVANILARFLTSVLNNHYLKVFECLGAKTLKQLVDFVGAIEDRNNN